MSKKTKRVLFIHEYQRWTVPTFARKKNLLEDAEPLLEIYSRGRIVPVQLYVSEDRGFEYGTYVCLVDCEFLTDAVKTLAWCDLDDIPKNIHAGLKNTINNQIVRAKLQTILELENATDQK